MSFFNPQTCRPDSMMESSQDRRRGNSQRLSEHVEEEFQRPINFNRLFKDELASGSDEEEYEQ